MRTGERERIRESVWEHKRANKKKGPVKFCQKFLKLKFPHQYHILPLWQLCSLVENPLLPQYSSSFSSFCRLPANTFTVFFVLFCLFFPICTPLVQHLYRLILKCFPHCWDCHVQRNIIASTCMFYFHTYYLILTIEQLKIERNVFFNKWKFNKIQRVKWLS